MAFRAITVLTWPFLRTPEERSRPDLRGRGRRFRGFEARLLHTEDNRPARLTALGGRRQVEVANLFGRALVGGDEEDALLLVLENQEAVESEVVDDHAERQVAAGSFVAERHLPVVAVSLDLDGQGDRLAGFDREFERLLT